MKGDEGIWFTGYQNVFKFTACLVMQKASTGETQKDCGSKYVIFPHKSLQIFLS